MAQKKLFGNAIREALLADGGKRLKLLAEVIINKAISGDTDAIKELNNRLKQVEIAKTEKAKTVMITGSGSAGYEPIEKEILPKPDWDNWKHRTELFLWEAA